LFDVVSKLLKLIHGPLRVACSVYLDEFVDEFIDEGSPSPVRETLTGRLRSIAAM
jgi:hypothetical protein